MRISHLLCPFQPAFAVVLVEVIKFYNAYQSVGILRVGGISGLLQSACPTLVVSNFQPEKKSISCTRTQELGMVLIRILGMPVSTEALIATVIVMAHRTPVPRTAALNSEMVVRFPCQSTPSRPRLQESLSKRDTGRNMIFPHFFHGYPPILLYIVLVSLISPLCRYRNRKSGNKY